MLLFSLFFFSCPYLQSFPFLQHSFFSSFSFVLIGRTSQRFRTPGGPCHCFSESQVMYIFGPFEGIEHILNPFNISGELSEILLVFNFEDLKLVQTFLVPIIDSPDFSNLSDLADLRDGFNNIDGGIHFSIESFHKFPILR